MAAGAVGMVICVVIFAILIGLIIGAVVLRCACWAYNKMVGAPGGPRRRYRDEEDERPRRRDAEQSDDEEDEEGDEDEDDDRPRPRRRPSVFDPDGPGVPEPSTGRAMGIVALNGVIGFVINLAVSFVLLGGVAAMGPGARPANLGAALASNGVQIVLGFFVLSLILTAMLPTKFGRACAVAALTYVIWIVIIAVIVIILVAVGIGFGAAGGFGR